MAGPLDCSPDELSSDNRVLELIDDIVNHFDEARDPGLDLTEWYQVKSPRLQEKLTKLINTYRMEVRKNGTKGTNTKTSAGR